ncbi:restriction endonuclease subunit S [Citrobacter portucalensis]|uniref:restriction endonuclease subunit S n=1 Tax=Citrobacter portucalensis TaxID=1639133 RepID=UPI0018A5A9B8|nr:restriction endonuclease subunit S [Citrobacter portucalensis]BBV46960.1 type I restriction modification protein [Citrobacter portucalensis]BBW15777.1 type I restriction modification protein [Citrobacter portucalensis]BBW42179.1 type I restriction modification protein [Citrobacter portucalensis]
MSKLTKYKFSDLYSMASGISSAKEQAGHGSPFLSFSVVFNNYFVPDLLSDLMDTSEKEKETYSIKSGDIFLTRTSEVVDELAMSCVAVKDYPNATFSGFLKRLRPTQDHITYPKFMAFYLRSPMFRKTMTNNAVMTLRASLNEAIFSYLELLLPAYPEQKKAGDLLYLLNQKIALNNRIKAELEAMAKTLYDYWFVQFNFPDTNGKPYKTSGGKMEYNATLKREIPADWNTSTLWSIAKYTNGLAMQKYREDSDIYLPVIKIREMNNGISAETERARVDIPEAAVIDDGDVLFSWSATLDVKIWSQGKGALNQHIFKVSSDSYPKSFYYFELLNYLKHFKMIADLRKTTMGHITLDHLKQAYICLPPLFLLEKLNSKVHDIFQKRLLLEKENRNLIKFRDWLLPLLMSGQVTVK